MLWIEVLLAVWGASALIVGWCYVSSMHERRSSGDS